MNNSTNAAPKFTVKRQGRDSWGVYRGARLVEGGFFYEDFAKQAAREHTEAAAMPALRAALAKVTP